MSMKKTATGFGGKLKALREASGLTQDQLAEKAGLNRHGLAKLEQEVGEPHWPTVLALAKALGVSCQDFIPDDSAGEPAADSETKMPQRGRPRKPDAPAATPSTPPAGELEAAAKKRLSRRRKGQ